MKVNSRFRSTKRKLASFFLFFLLEEIQKVNGEYPSYFENCLNFYTYNTYSYFPLNSSFFYNNSEIKDDKITSFCCNSKKCALSTPQNCSLFKPYLEENPMFYCNKINGSVFCNNGKFCGGIVDGK